MVEDLSLQIKTSALHDSLVICLLFLTLVSQQDSKAGPGSRSATWTESSGVQRPRVGKQNQSVERPRLRVRRVAVPLGVPLLSPYADAVAAAGVVPTDTGSACPLRSTSLST